MLRYTLVFLAGLSLAVSARADSWAEALFDGLAKDFGTVPRGPTLDHSFRLTNKTGQPLHIAGVRVSCGCVSAAAQHDHLAPGQSTAIYATMDTLRFTGHKKVTIYVQFDQPQWQEVRLSVQANGRDDLSVSPDSFVFGKVKKGTAPAVTVTVSFLGGSHWQISAVERESNYVQASVKELRRDAGEVSYQVTAGIRADTPVGKWYSDLWLKTNDQSVPKIRVPLTIEIEPSLSLSPASIALGQVKPGSEMERKIVVRGVKPFRITRIEGSDDQWSVQFNAQESKPVHVLTVKLKAARPGETARNLKVFTDVEDEGELQFQAKAQVTAQPK